MEGYIMIMKDRAFVCTLQKKLSMPVAEILLWKVGDGKGAKFNIYFKTEPEDLKIESEDSAVLVP